MHLKLSYFYLQILLFSDFLEFISCQILICIVHEFKAFILFLLFAFLNSFPVKIFICYVVCVFKAIILYCLLSWLFRILFHARYFFVIFCLFFMLHQTNILVWYIWLQELCLLYGFLNPSVHFSVPALNLLLRLSRLLLWFVLAHCWIIVVYFTQ